MVRRTKDSHEKIKFVNIELQIFQGSIKITMLEDDIYILCLEGLGVTLHVFQQVPPICLAHRIQMYRGQAKEFIHILIDISLFKFEQRLHEVFMAVGSGEKAVHSL